MTTTASTHRTQLRLPGQTAAPDGPVDLSMMFVMHHGFRRDLRAFAAAAARTPLEDRAAWRALADRWALFSTILHHHHSVEDTSLWPRLLVHVDAAGDAAARKTLEDMASEHELIDPLLADCAAGFTRLADVADPATRSALAARLVEANEQLGHHLRHEETEALALAQRYMTQAEWDAMEHAAEAGRVSPRELPRMVGWMMHGLPQPGVERMVRRSNPVMKWLWQAFWRRSFERVESVAFRHV